MKQPVMGILTLYLNDSRSLEERGIYQKMIAKGQKIGLHVFVFTPQDVDYKNNRIHAMFYDPSTGSWSRRWTKFPDLIYDRCRIQRSHRFQQLLYFRSRYSHLCFLNRPLRNKWTIHRQLYKDERFRPYLPSSRYYDSVEDVSDMLRKHSLLYVKPIHGTGGRGILRIEKQKDGRLLVQGRDQSRRIIKPLRLSQAQLGSLLTSWQLKSKRYLVQQGIAVKLSNGRVHDYRLLVQKNKDGVWSYTGCAARVGAGKSITSNLHGGGKAVPMDDMLREWLVAPSTATAVKEEAAKISIEIAAYLEKSYSRLCELALDLAIDRHGGIWLLEVNPKPAREVFVQAGEQEVYDRAISKPLEYGLWLYRQEISQASGKRKSRRRTPRTQSRSSS